MLFAREKRIDYILLAFQRGKGGKKLDSPSAGVEKIKKRLLEKKVSALSAVSDGERGKWDRAEPKKGSATQERGKANINEKRGKRN